MCLKTHVSFMCIGEEASTEITQLCAFCKTTKTANDLTAGRMYANKHQALVCAEHVWNKSKWLTGWARFQEEQDNKAQVPIQTVENQFVLETRITPILTDVPNDVAYHLQVRQHLGKVVIIAERPAVFLSVLRRRWMRILRVLQRERASTLDLILIKQLGKDVERMQTMRFTCCKLIETDDYDVCVMSPEQAQNISHTFSTLYVCASKVQVDDAVYARAAEECVVIVTYK